MKTIEQLQSENETMAAQIVALSEALEFYGNNWVLASRNSGCEYSKPNECLLDDMGRTAQHALSIKPSEAVERMRKNAKTIWAVYHTDGTLWESYDSKERAKATADLYGFKLVKLSCVEVE